jgi:hypothetical protein
VKSSENDEDDDAFLEGLIISEEDRRRLFPTTMWTGGYRWFRSHNVVCLERYRSPAERTRMFEILLAGRR